MAAGSSGGPTSMEPQETSGGDDGRGAEDPPSPTETHPRSRFRRIARSDLDRVLSDLLGFPVDVARSFPDELATLDGYLERDGLAVNSRFRVALQLAAEGLAEALLADPAAYAAVVSCDPTAPGCRDDFLDTFVGRAYRRPITDSERASYRALFDAASGALQGPDPFADGVRLVVDAALQSPNFLYQIERGEIGPDGIRRATSHEMATRLSFLLWSTIPDSELRAAADEGGLTTTPQLEAQTDRMLADPRAASTIADFHGRWMRLDALPTASKDVERYPEFSPALVADMQREFDRFVEEITIRRGGSIDQLLTAPFTFADPTLESVYGTDASGRAGLLTQPAFLTGHSSSSSGTSPILRGVFVLDRILCVDLPDPPANAVAVEPPPPAVPPITTRDLFTWKTSLAECAGCHGIINPVGWAFEEFDAIGRYRTVENGAPIDATGTLVTAEGAVSFDGVHDFATKIAGLEQVRSCYAKNWLEFAYGRPADAEDMATIVRLRDGFAQPGFGAPQVLRTLATSPAFRRISEE